MAARRADALARIAESFLQHGLEAMGGGDRHQVVVHVDVHTLRGRGSEDGASCCGFEHGPGLPAETVRRLACDSSRVTLVEDERGEPLDVGRKTRSIPPALRRALQSRDRGCRFPGCTHTRFVDAHHIRHWAHGGQTRLGNLVTLCRFHHRAVHEGGARIEVLDDGALRFLNVRGEVCLPSPALHGGVGGVVAFNAEAGIEVDASTAVSRWGGERLDHALAMASLLSVRRGTA
jgi:hypothetical protein